MDKQPSQSFSAKCGKIFRTMTAAIGRSCSPVGSQQRHRAGGAPLPDGSADFMWQDMMTREQLVTVLYRFAQKLGMI